MRAKTIFVQALVAMAAASAWGQCVPPSIQTQPGTREWCIAMPPASFEIVASGSAPLGYQWRAEGVEIPGADQSVFTDHAPANRRRFDCIVSNACGSIVSEMTEYAQDCVSHVWDCDDTGPCGCGVIGQTTYWPVVAYLMAFNEGSVGADCDDGSGTGIRDGGVTIDDLLYFLLRFDGGC